MNGQPAPVCPHCHHSNSSMAQRCAKCKAPLSGSDDQATQMLEAGWSRPAAGTQTLVDQFPVLGPGRVLGERYEILKELGRGGMGAVYKTRDRELDRIVALKVIRPDLAGHPEVLERFKQELILARQVTHRNVIRIFDLATADGVKYITMEYIEGRDLANRIEERKPTIEESVLIMRQVCGALQ